MFLASVGHRPWGASPLLPHAVGADHSLRSTRAQKHACEYFKKMTEGEKMRAAGGAHCKGLRVRGPLP